MFRDEQVMRIHNFAQKPGFFEHGLCFFKPNRNFFTKIAFCTKEIAIFYANSHVNWQTGIKINVIFYENFTKLS